MNQPSDQDGQNQSPAPRIAPPVQQLTAFAALVLSIFALGVSLFEVSALRTQQRAAVWPYLSVEQRYSSEGYGLEVANKGVGPALVRSVTLMLDDAAVADLDTLILGAVGEGQVFSYELYRTSNLAGGVMSAGEIEGLFSAPWEDRTRVFADAFSSRGDISICYCSIYGECWVTTLKGSRDPDPIETCPS